MTEFTSEFIAEQKEIFSGEEIDSLMMTEALEHYPEALDHIEKQAKRIEELEQERRWIPISERLPEIFGWYQVYGRDASTRRNINVEYFRLNSKTFSGGLHITHWKDLPQPPQEEE